MFWVKTSTRTPCYHFQFYDLRDKYALAQKEISQLNNKLQDAEYDLQKSNHRVDNLVKRMNEMEEAKKKMPEGEVAEGSSSSSCDAVSVQSVGDRPAMIHFSMIRYVQYPDTVVTIRYTIRYVT